ncbi:uncharacterized protein LOC118464000 [Anopheles albimanus]|uniref:Protein TsetseEP domain-containing protein n=1 Tax=Anopheles albimanus TaxID=7167 RepID=A0A182FVA9_ANOAL|nr:uncharacterized protein LOC118464000 [Anopheles albimanus]
MKVTHRFSLVLGLVTILVQLHSVHGDFGIPPTISGVAVLMSYANQITSELSALQLQVANIPNDSVRPQFNEAGAAIVAILNETQVLIQPIGPAIRLLAPDDVGPAETLFEAVDTRIDAAIGFINGTGQTMLATVETKVSSVVHRNLNFFLSAINVTLGELKTALATLRTGVINARTAASRSSSGYTPSLITQNVRPAMISAVQDKTLQLSGNIPAGAEIARATVRILTKANEFIARTLVGKNSTELKLLWDGELFPDYTRGTTDLAFLTTFVDNAIPSVKSTLGKFAANYSTVTGNLTTSYDEVDETYEQVTAGVDSNLLNAYKTLVSITFTMLEDFVQQIIPPIQASIINVTTVLVQQLDRAEICFAAYYPQIDQYIITADASGIGCLDVEIQRQKNMIGVVLETLGMMQYFLEDADDHLQVCLRVSLFDESLANACLKEFSDFTRPIVCTTKKQYATILQVLCKEVDSIRYRLWSCLAPTLDDLRRLIESIHTGFQSCRGV